MPLNLAHVPTKVIAVGMSGCGKTLWMNDFIRRSDYRYYFIFDHDGQFRFRNKLKAAQNSGGILAQLKASRFVVFDPTEMFNDMEQALAWFCGYVYKFSEHLPGKKLIFVDEFQDIITCHKIPTNVRKVLVSGRNRSLDFACCSLQYNMIHNQVRGQATMTVAFFTEEKLALRALQERGFNEEEIKALKPGSYVLKNSRTTEWKRGKIF